MNLGWFMCAACGNAYPKGRTDEEALAEYRATFPDLANEPAVTLCTSCYDLRLTLYLMFGPRNP